MLFLTEFDPLCRGTFSLARRINAQTFNGFEIPLTPSNLALLLCKMLTFCWTKYCGLNLSLLLKRNQVDRKASDLTIRRLMSERELYNLVISLPSTL